MSFVNHPTKNIGVQASRGSNGFGVVVLSLRDGECIEELNPKEARQLADMLNHHALVAESIKPSHLQEKPHGSEHHRAAASSNGIQQPQSYALARHARAHASRH